MGRAIARSKWDAPEIDGQVIVDNADGIKPGDKVSVLVTGSATSTTCSPSRSRR